MRTLHTALAVAAALVALAFSLATYERWRLRRRPHEAAWSASLAMFSLAAASMAVGSQTGWSGPVFRSFYLFGAILNVPFLALGTIYLLTPRRFADRTAVAICLGGAFAAGVLAVAPFTAALPRDELARGSEVFGALPRIFAAVASGVGALVVFGGAVWSAIRIRRGRMVLANGLIAAGTLILSASGVLNSVLDEITGFSVTLLAGITVIFAGFLVATSAPRPASARAAVALSPPSAPGAAASRPDHEAAQGRT